MHRFIRYTLTLSGLIVVTLAGLLLSSRRHPSNAYWLLVSQDSGSQQQLAKMSPAGGRLFPITPKWRAFRELEALADDEWLYLAHYPGQYDADGRERAELIRVHRADLHYELFGWLSVSETLTPMPDGDWLVTNLSYQTTGFYRLRRDGTGRQLIFRFDDPNLIIPTFPVVQFSPDGHWLYFNATHTANTQLRVYRVRLDGSDLTNLYDRLTEPYFLALMNWPPTDQWVFVETGSGEGSSLMLLGVDGSESGRLLTNLNVLSDQTWEASWGDVMLLRDTHSETLMAVRPRAFMPEWQGDEFVRTVQQMPSGEVVINTSAGISILHPDGTTTLLAPLTNIVESNFFLPPYPADWVYFHLINRQSANSIHRLNIHTGEIRPVVASAHLIDAVQFSPDGGWLVFRAIMDNRPGLYRVNADGSGLYRITDKYADPLVVDFGPPIDRTWSAALLVGIGVVLLVVGGRGIMGVKRRGHLQGRLSPPPTPPHLVERGFNRPFSAPPRYSVERGPGGEDGFLQHPQRLTLSRKKHAVAEDTP